MIKKMAAGDKKNTAGEQFYFSRFNNKLKMKLGEGSWSAGFANRENLRIFGALKIHEDFFGTREGF